MVSRLQLINDALIATGNDVLNVEFDGSSEWTAAESAYRRAVGALLSAHDWNFATQTAELGPPLATNPSEMFSYAYQLPAESLSVEAVYGGGVALNRYEIVDGKVCANYSSGLVVRYVRAPSESAWPLHFSELLTIKIEELLLRGLNEESSRADMRKRDFDALLADVRSRTDSQEGRRAVFRSRSAARRRGGSASGALWP